MSNASRFFLIWSTPAPTFSPRFTRSVESIFRHHPAAHISVLSNTLPLNYFRQLTDVGLDLEVERYDLGALVTNSRAQVWYDFRRFWNRSAFFPNHEADLLRLLTLRQRGGVYVDTDVIFVRPLPISRCVNVVGVEAGSGGVSAAQLLPDAPVSSLETGLPTGSVLCNAVMSFARTAPLLDTLIEAFVEDYVPFPPGWSMLVGLRPSELSYSFP